MEIKYHGGNCIKIVSKKSVIVVDDVVHLGLKSQVTDKDILLITDERAATRSQAKFVIDGPGEYEVSDISVMGIPTRAHIDTQDEKSGSTIYRVIVDDIRIAVVGHIYPELSEDQLEALGTVDIMTIPVGGNGYTIDGVGAQKIIRKIEPKIVIPTHYNDNALNYEVPQQELDDALKALAMEPAETVDSLKVKSVELLDTTKLIVINRK